MKRLTTILALILAFSPLVFAQTADTKKPQGAAAAEAGGVEQTLMQIERDATAAILKRDAAKLGSFMADDFVFTGPDGATQTKAQLLADVKSGDLQLDASDISDMKVRVFGDTAVVTYTTADKGKYKARDITGRYRWIDVFVRRSGKWQLVAGQGTPIQ